MKKGDLVKAENGSYVLEFDNGELIPVHGVELKEWHWKILSNNCRLPAADGSYDNDTIICSMDNVNRLVFIQEELLVPYHDFCPCCGQRRQ